MAGRTRLGLKFSAHRLARILMSASRRSFGSGSAAVSVCPPALDADGAVAAGGAHKFLDAPTGLDLNPVADSHRGDHDAQVRLDRFPDVVIDRPGLQGRAWTCGSSSRCASNWVIGVDDELGGLAGEVGGVALPAGQGAVLGLQLAVDGLGGAGELDEPVALDRGVTIRQHAGLWRSVRRCRAVCAALGRGGIGSRRPDPGCLGPAHCWWQATARVQHQLRQGLPRRGVCRATHGPRQAGTGYERPGCKRQSRGPQRDLVGFRRSVRRQRPR